MGARFVKQIFLLVAILIFGLSCTNREKDSSLPLDDYLRAGVPDLNKKWTFADYTQAYNTLAEIKWEEPLRLPVNESKKSGALFEHLVSLEYLSFLRDSTMSLNEKAERISEFTRVYDYWMDVYTNPTLKRNHYHREIVEIQIFNLRLTEAMLGLAHEINRSDDPADMALQYGYEAIKGNYLTCLQTDMKMQRYTSDFTEQDLTKVADSVFSSVTRNKHWMDSATIGVLTLSLHHVIDSTSSDYIRNKYGRLEKFLSGDDPKYLKSHYLTK